MGIGGAQSPAVLLTGQGPLPQGSPLASREESKEASGEAQCLADGSMLGLAAYSDRARETGRLELGSEEGCPQRCPGRPEEVYMIISVGSNRAAAIACSSVLASAWVL